MKPNKLKKFKEYLKESGCVILDLTNEWEVIRFKCEKGTGVIYKNKKDRMTFTGPADEAYDNFTARKPWNSSAKKKRRKSQAIVDALWERDGNECFYCGKEFTHDEPDTLEHLLSIASGGNNHMDNLVLAHEYCNRQADNMSIVEKVKFREGFYEC